MAVTVIVCMPRPTSVPAAGLWLSVRLVSQLSLAVTPPSTFGIGAWQLALALAPVPAGQFTVGGVASTTVKATTHSAQLLAASFTVTVIGCEAAPVTALPGSGLCVITKSAAAVRSSEDFTRTNSRTSGAAAWQVSPAVVLCAATSAHAITGGVVSAVRVSSNRQPSNATALPQLRSATYKVQAPAGLVPLNWLKKASRCRLVEVTCAGSSRRASGTHGPSKVASLRGPPKGTKSVPKIVSRYR